ncbi:hypothetical protein BOX15_Mlig027930g1, partial [Macrostomum lignano]
DYRLQSQRGPGRKTRKQKDPKLPASIETEVDAEEAAGPRQLSSRQKQRMKRRVVKQATVAAKKMEKQKKKLEQQRSNGDNAGPPKPPRPDEEESDEADEDMDSLDELEQAQTAEANKSSKRLRLDLDEDDSAEEEGGTAGRTLLEEEDEDFLNDDFPISDEDADEAEDSDSSEGVEKEAADEAGEDDDAEEAGQADEDEAAKAADLQQAPADLSELDGRIDSLLQLLGNSGDSVEKAKKKKSPKTGAKFSRSDCLDRLCSLLCMRFSYNAFLMRRLLDLYPKDILDFLQSNEVDRPLTLRTNALKTRRKDLAQALISRGVNLDPFDKWSKVGLVVYDSQVPLGATPEYLAGHYMLQGAASMLPVLALDPKPQEKVLDLCAAPGGKTTYIAELMRNTGLVMANEANKERAKAVVGNAHRHGLNNIVVCVGDGREFPRTMHNFDRVLVDAPCTGTGVIAKDPAVKANKEEKDVLKCSHLQKQLLLAGVDAAKAGGVIVYCTCSVLVEENEAVVDYALRKRQLKLVETGLVIGEPAFRAFRDKKFYPSMTAARRITPHQHNMDGFFVAKLVKSAAGGAKPTAVSSKSSSNNSKKKNGTAEAK